MDVAALRGPLQAPARRPYTSVRCSTFPVLSPIDSALTPAFVSMVMYRFVIGANLFQQGFVAVIVQEIDLEPWRRSCSLSDVSGEVDNGFARGGIIGAWLKESRPNPIRRIWQASER